MKSMDVYSRVPEEMVNYIDNYGFHFSRKACEWAVGLMRKRSGGQPEAAAVRPRSLAGEGQKVNMWDREYVDGMLKRNGIELENAKLYDYVYVANMAQADLLGSSIEDEKHLARYIKDVIDDVDASDESVFRCWLAKMRGNGVPVDWEELL